MRLSVSHSFLPKHPTAHAAVVMDHFGIDFERGEHTIASDLDLPLESGDIVCFTGPSGSGKSSLMRAVAGQLEGLLDINALDLGQEILVDALGLPAAAALELLATCGLGEARLLLRTPAELSDGQRYRFRLAAALARRPAWVLADEFTATLDRTLAKVVSYNLHRLARQTGTGFVIATTHEDLLDDLQPTLHVRCDLDGSITCVRSDAPAAPMPAASPQKKSRLASAETSKLPPAPVRTGRTSLGGITAATRSDSSAT